MMCKKKSSRWSSAKLLFVLPLVALSLAATATTVYVTVDNIDESKVKQNSQNNQTQSRIEERTFDTEVVKDDIFALSPAGSERYNLVPAEANATTQQSEKREIKGKVLDEQGKPIGGVFVLIKNKPFGAATDSEGNFGGLKVTNGDYLDISHVGYERQEVAVMGKSSITIFLKTKIYTTETAAEVSGEPAVLKAEVMPKFMGGDLNKFRNWVQMHIKYPKVAQEQGIQGRVIAEFVIEKDGKVSFSKIMESPHESLSAEIEGAIRHSPNWTPGTNGGKPVRVKMHIPVNFAIRNGGKEASIGNIRVISNTKFVYNGETYDQIGIAKALESYNQDKINVHVDSETTISPFLDFILKRIVKEVNYIYLNKFTTVDDKELHSSIIQYYHNNVLRRIRNDECAVGVVYVDITVGRTGVMTIEKISSKCKSAEVGSYLEKKVEFSLKGFPIVSIREKIEEPQSIRLEVAFAKRENGEVFMPDVELGKDALTIIGGEPLSMAKNKPASSNNDEEDQPLIKAEQSPSFQGGDLDDYRSWVESQIEIPKKLQKKFDGGVVTFEFAIESDGSVTFSKILHSPHELLSAEVERVVKSSPKFTPAKQRGESVQVKVQTGVKFVKKKN
jgi:TonB family protein